jgi:hypothetical protein
LRYRRSDNQRDAPGAQQEKQTQNEGIDYLAVAIGEFL